jgi:hypothetical protein
MFTQTVGYIAKQFHFWEMCLYYREDVAILGTGKCEFGVKLSNQDLIHDWPTLFKGQLNKRYFLFITVYAEFYFLFTK